MELYDLQIDIYKRVERGEFGSVEVTGFRSGKIENPLQVILVHKDTLMARIVDISRDDGSIISDLLEEFDDFFPSDKK